MKRRRIPDPAGIPHRVPRTSLHRRSKALPAASPPAHARAPAPESLLIEGVQDYAIFRLDLNGYVASWNKGAQRIKGYASEEIIGRHFSTFYPAEAVERGWPDEELRRARREGRFEDEGWRVRKDGSLMWANVVITALFDEAGNAVGFSKITRDLSERRRRERALSESESNLRLLIDNVRDHALFLVGSDGRIASWNSGAERLFGYPAERVVGTDAALLYTDEDRNQLVPESDLTAARDEGFTQTVGWRTKADGTRIWSDVTISVSRDRDGAINGYVEVVHDLSERRRVQQLELESRHLGEFIAVLSHELRNPLAPIVSAAQVLQQRISDPKTRQVVEVIGRQSDHLARLVDDLLDVNRVATGKMRLRLVPTDLRKVLQASIESVRTEIAANQQALHTTIDDHPWTVAADGIRLTQAIVNLLTNATRYTPAGGRIVVELAGGDGFATVRVVDSGIGMSEELTRRAFDPFHQGDRTSARAHGGLGIGLTLVRKIVELHRGSIAVKSAPEEGTAVTVRLPLVDAAAAAPARSREAQRPRPARPSRKVLVVDDNHDAAESLALFLSMRGFEVNTAGGGPEAIALARRFPPDVVLLDLGMPIMDGFEVARRLKAMPEGAAARLIAVTGYGQPRDKIATREAGFEMHFVKPVDPEVLARCIERPEPNGATNSPQPA